MNTKVLLSPSKVPREALYPGLNPLIAPGKLQTVVTPDVVQRYHRKLTNLQKKHEPSITETLNTYDASTAQPARVVQGKENTDIVTGLRGEPVKVLIEKNEEDNEKKKKNGDTCFLKETEGRNLQLGLLSGSTRKMSEPSRDLIDFFDPEESKQDPKYIKKETPNENKPVSNKNLPPIKIFGFRALSNTLNVLNTDSGQSIGSVVYLYVVYLHIGYVLLKPVLLLYLVFSSYIYN